ncbi:hypothetical protein D3C71_1195340 [compost metagenome]
MTQTMGRGSAQVRHNCPVGSDTTALSCFSGPAMARWPSGPSGRTTGASAPRSSDDPSEIKRTTRPRLENRAPRPPWAMRRASGAKTASFSPLKNQPSSPRSRPCRAIVSPIQPASAVGNPWKSSGTTGVTPGGVTSRAAPVGPTARRRGRSPSIAATSKASDAGDQVSRLVEMSRASGGSRISPERLSTSRRARVRRNSAAASAEGSGLSAPSTIRATWRPSGEASRSRKGPRARLAAAPVRASIRQRTRLGRSGSGPSPTETNAASPRAARSQSRGSSLCVRLVSARR